MFGIRYMKAAPTTYVIHFRGGQVRREGAGLAFFYCGPASEIAAVPVGSADVPFAFAGATADFQAVTVQGQLTYRVAEPRRLASVLDYTIDPRGRHRSEDPEKLPERIVQEAQVLASAFLERHALKDVLRRAGELSAAVMTGLRSSAVATMLGVEPLAFAVLSLKPTPEMARALEAEAREALQREADLAIYARRNTAVEQERRIKESELNTEIAVEEKKRQIRETQTAADIAVEERRRFLIELRGRNEREEADSRSYALAAVLKPVAKVDWKTLLVLGKSALDPRALIALAFRDLAENAAKIGSLNISPDLLEALTKE